MRTKKFLYKCLLTTVLLLSSAVFLACVSSKKSGSKTERPSAATEKSSAATEEPFGKDSIQASDSAFVPTHPPVVVPHSWRESRK
ncbi:MAG: hypothetical protein IIX29_01805 [Bacteroidales bacterium]|nr:hypothetical protein [Bacteroidales bacterium]